jgi:hypothetical protein
VNGRLEANPNLPCQHSLWGKCPVSPRWSLTRLLFVIFFIIFRGNMLSDQNNCVYECMELILIYSAEYNGSQNILAIMRPPGLRAISRSSQTKGNTMGTRLHTLYLISTLFIPTLPHLAHLLLSKSQYRLSLVAKFKH